MALPLAVWPALAAVASAIDLLHSLFDKSPPARGCAGTNYPFLTLKERDVETGLDYFGARCYASTQGRFTSADEFWKDSQVSDPQSWNKYAYVRNSPLRYIDPEGEKATVKIETDEKNKTGTIIITATIAIWTQEDSGLTQDDMK